MEITLTLNTILSQELFKINKDTPIFIDKERALSNLKRDYFYQNKNEFPKNLEEQLDKLISKQPYKDIKIVYHPKWGAKSLKLRVGNFNILGNALFIKLNILQE